MAWTTTKGKGSATPEQSVESGHGHAGWGGHPAEPKPPTRAGEPGGYRLLPCYANRTNLTSSARVRASTPIHCTRIGLW